MTFKKHLTATAVFAAASAAFPVYAGLTIIEVNPAPKPVLTQVQIVEEGTRMRDENLRASAEIERLRADLARVQADLTASQTRVNFSALNQSLTAMESRMNELGVFIMKSSFGLNSARFQPTSDTRELLLAAARKAARISVTGHADNIGSSYANKRIAMARALSTKKYLTDNGVARSKVVVVSRGSSDPIADNATEEGRYQNRRVEIQFNR